ncbi:uncharacterized protein SPPG_00858 [Spizellomyces punctatus DAOM BR117]|uniref:THO complex subunit 1 n=1 Tax=Spizellomyces punctatus (strain DAOM BR117) TaxID=645134 RepID=A0A0L0HVQ9_SPIPD|nr:uncharacterized protein SPPG_00858 [Spizellomyces punctatus DAOM BR117]KND05198.1 hypothetical protein SPPG_00858 [Spizellomyces punctatus DAOM BR117]|eukprot:XP_016613237.1 hypothetical protein SPPG_00858 [Spizellomyces punctatus DAOM BR117]
MSNLKRSTGKNGMAEEDIRKALLDVLAQVSGLAKEDKTRVFREAVREKLSVEPAYHGMLSTAFNSIMLDIVERSSREDDALFAALYDLLDAALHCTEAGVQDQTVPFNIIEDLLDVLTISGAERVVEYLETRADRLTVGINPSKGKGLVLLRLCNEILRRLSKTKNTVTSGRILMFMANVYPLSERSGVNLRGEFNVKNETHYEGEDIQDPMDIDEADALNSSQESLYRIFWHLQRFFANPSLLWQTANFNRFQKGIDATLKRFDDINKETTSQSAKHKDDKQGSHDRKRKHRASDSSEQIDAAKHPSANGKIELFFPKFLTSPNLFDLELRDPYFRRQILAQFSIILQYLSVLTQDEKDKVAKEFAENKDSILNKAVQQAYTLTSEQEAWVKDARNRAYSVSEATYPYGKLFARNLSTVITHERNWIEWKNRSCQTFETPRIKVEEGAAKPKLQGSDAVRRSNWLGSDHMTSLWAQGDKAEEVMRDAKRRRMMPALDTLLEQLDEQLDDSGNLTGGIEEEYALHKDMRFSWRSYRVAMRHHMYLFHGSRQVEIQIDNQAPGKTLLMEWRKERKRAETSTTEQNETIADATQANQQDTDMADMEGSTGEVEEKPQSSTTLSTPDHSQQRLVSELEVGEVTPPLKGISKDPADQPEPGLVDPVNQPEAEVSANEETTVTDEATPTAALPITATIIAGDAAS